MTGSIVCGVDPFAACSALVWRTGERADNESVTLIMTEQDEYASRADALIKVVSTADRTDGPGLGVPDGIAQMSWVNFDGFTKMIEIVQWRRIDQGMFKVGAEFNIHLQARRYRDLRLPLSTETIRCRATMNKADSTLIAVGDVMNPQGWLFGVHVVGAEVLGPPEL